MATPSKNLTPRQAAAARIWVKSGGPEGKFTKADLARSLKLSRRTVVSYFQSDPFLKFVDEVSKEVEQIYISPEQYLENLEPEDRRKLLKMLAKDAVETSGANLIGLSELRKLEKVVSRNMSGMDVGDKLKLAHRIMKAAGMLFYEAGGVSEGYRKAFEQDGTLVDVVAFADAELFETEYLLDLSRQVKQFGSKAKKYRESGEEAEDLELIDSVRGLRRKVRGLREGGRSGNLLDDDRELEDDLDDDLEDMKPRKAHRSFHDKAPAPIRADIMAEEVERKVDSLEDLAELAGEAEG